MKRICLRCNVISQDFNLWCQEKHCPAENATEILDNGEWFGPIEIIEPIVILRSAIVYHAQQGDQKVLLKIANYGCEDKLRHEAKAFLQLAKAGQHPLLPVLLPAHPGGSVTDHPYGWTVVNGKVKYFEVFQFAEGEILRNYLLKNPQPWFQHVGWISLSVLDVVYYLHKAGKLHLCLNPDVVLVRFDKQGIPRAMLIDLGVGDTAENSLQMWNDDFNLPAYTAPEIVAGGKVGPSADVYGVGMLLYEMLAGRPAHEYHLRKDPIVLHSVVNQKPKGTGRVDLKTIPDVAEKAIDRQPQNRYPDLLSMAQALRPNFPPLPAERKPARVNWQHVFVVLGALLAVSLLVLFAVSMLP